MDGPFMVPIAIMASVWTLTILAGACLLMWINAKSRGWQAGYKAAVDEVKKNTTKTGLVRYALDAKTGEIKIVDKHKILTGL
jgi:ferric-dicitrate binding protein FerR (iron transport regulator)